MGATVGFVDNEPHGTIMILRLPQQTLQQHIESASPVETSDIHSKNISSPSGVASYSTERIAENEEVLQSRRILVSCICCPCYR
jgi:hypothetical protein